MTHSLSGSDLACTEGRLQPTIAISNVGLLSGTFEGVARIRAKGRNVSP